MRLDLTAFPPFGEPSKSSREFPQESGETDNLKKEQSRGSVPAFSNNIIRGCAVAQPLLLKTLISP
jgi:hypothetical protein